MLEIKNVTKTYSGKKALDDVTLTIPQGEIIGLFGENGAGKTTLMKSVFGFIPFKGEITLDGEPITTANIARLAFATCEHSFFPNLTAKGHREFYQEHFPKFSLKRFEGLMEFFELPMNKPIRSFSTGQKNQFEVIMALCQGADYILMDEPFAGNDVFNRELFRHGFELTKRAGLSAVRIDTHEGNLPMRRALEKAGFTFCGRITLIGGSEDGDPRLAFEKILE